MRKFRLDPWHYAAKWEIISSDKFYEVSHINKLGQDYAIMEDGQKREDLLLEILHCFHSYLMKYVDMILRGHLSTYNYRSRNKDTVAFLKYFINKKDKITKQSMHTAAKFLHLAFKQQDVNDVYDVLVLCMLRAIKKYDPYYTNKLRRVIEFINGIKNQKSFTPGEISTKLGFDSVKYLRLLSRNGLLAAEREHKKVVRYSLIDDKWPPNPKDFGGGQVGFVYFVQKWYRYFLKGYIERSLYDIESKGNEIGYGLMQLDHRPISNNQDASGERLVPSIIGELKDRDGHTWAADLDLVNKSFDLNGLDMEWVRETSDPLFKNMTPSERYILYARFVQEQPLHVIARAIKVDFHECRRLYSQILVYLKDRAAFRRSRHTNQ